MSDVVNRSLTSVNLTIISMLQFLYNAALVLGTDAYFEGSSQYFPIVKGI
jgi:hypothetical protein